VTVPRGVQTVDFNNLLVQKMSCTSENVVVDFSSLCAAKG